MNHHRAPFTSTPQDGTPGHCSVAQVWNANGEPVANVEPTDDKDVATKIAEIIAMALNRVCERCEGNGFHDNPDAHWHTDRDGADYLDGPEEVDCELCHGVGFVLPRPSPPPASKLPPVDDDDDLPF